MQNFVNVKTGVDAKVVDKRKEIGLMFDNIASKYDLLNRVLSLGVDKYWRYKALKLTKLTEGAILLDVACGTGDVAQSARKMGVKKIFAADYSFKMLELFSIKKTWITGLNTQVAAEMLPFKNQSFSNITVAFGVRNFYDLDLAFSSFYRVLKHGGKTTILEFSMPKNFIINFFYKLYFKYILPKIGKLVSKDTFAYAYLPESVEQFDREIDLTAVLVKNGFTAVEKKSLTFGLVQIVIGTKF